MITVQLAAGILPGLCSTELTTVPVCNACWVHSADRDGLINTTIRASGSAKVRQAPSGARETLHPAWGHVIGNYWPPFRIWYYLLIHSLEFGSVERDVAALKLQKQRFGAVVGEYVPLVLYLVQLWPFKDTCFRSAFLPFAHTGT